MSDLPGLKIVKPKRLLGRRFEGYTRSVKVRGWLLACLCGIYKIKSAQCYHVSCISEVSVVVSIPGVAVSQLINSTTIS